MTKNQVFQKITNNQEIINNQVSDNQNLEFDNQTFKNQNSNNKFNLEQRTLIFSKKVIKLCYLIKHNVINKKLIEQLIRSAGSLGENYREANDALGKKDFVHRLRIARKEAKETLY